MMFYIEFQKLVAAGENQIWVVQ